MHTYQLKNLKGTVLAEGTFRDCWKYLVDNFGHLTVKEAFDTGLVIE